MYTLLKQNLIYLVSRTMKAAAMRDNPGKYQKAAHMYKGICLHNDDDEED